MTDIRITYSSDKEKEKIINTLREKHNIISISRPYRNLRNKLIEEYRVYIKVEI